MAQTTEVDEARTNSAPVKASLRYRTPSGLQVNPVYRVVAGEVIHGDD